MIKLRPSANDQELADNVAAFLAEHGREAVRNSRNFEPDDERYYAQVVKHLGLHYGQLSRLLKLTMNDQASLMAHEIVAKLMLAAWNLGQAAVIAPEVQQKLAEHKTKKMRDAREATPFERAIRDAVQAEHGEGPVAQPKKEAGAILDAVNIRLKEAGHSPVKIDVIRRRLAKLVRS